MAALTTGRITPQKLGTPFPRRVNAGVKANTTIFFGSIVCVDASNRAVPATAATGLVALGVLLEQPGQIPGGSVVGNATDRAVQIQVTPGVFAFDQDGTVLATTPYGTALYAVDDHTVTITSTGASQIGTLEQVTTSTDPQIGAQVWVNVGAAATVD